MSDWLSYNNKVILFNSKPITHLVLPAMPPISVRFLFTDNSFDPTTAKPDTTFYYWNEVIPNSGVWDYIYRPLPWSGSPTTPVELSWKDIFEGDLTHRLVGSDNYVHVLGIGELSSTYQGTYGDFTATVTDTEAMFYGCDAIVGATIDKILPSYAYLFASTGIRKASINTQGVTSMNYMFESCTGITNLSDIDIDTTSLEYAGHMFSGISVEHISGLNLDRLIGADYMFSGSDVQTIDISTPRLTRAGHMFHGCRDLTSATIRGTSSLTDANNMFYFCSSLTDVSLDTSSVSNANHMFDRCTSLESVDIDISNIETGVSMFDGCTSLVSTPSGAASKMTNSTTMFYGCRALTDVNITSWPLLTATNDNLAGMFSYCYALVSLEIDMPLNRDFRYMFYNCTSLQSVTFKNAAANMLADHAFYGCTGLKTIPTIQTTFGNVTSMFAACYNVESGSYAMYQQMSSQATVPSSHSQAFRNCGRDTVTGAAELAQIPSDWK